MNHHRRINCAISLEKSLPPEYEIPLPIIVLQPSIRRVTPFHERHANQPAFFRNYRMPFQLTTNEPPAICGTKVSRSIVRKGFGEASQRRQSAPKYQSEDSNNFPEESCGTDCPEPVLTVVPENREEKVKSKRRNIMKPQKQNRPPIKTLKESSNRAYSTLPRARTMHPPTTSLRMPPIIKVKRVQTTNGYPTCLNPINLEKQEKIFFGSNCSINPIFEYDNLYAAERVLDIYKLPKTDLLPIAIQIMEKLLADYGSESKYLEETGGPVLTLEETQEIYSAYIRSLGLENNITLAFAENTVSPTTILHDGNKGKSTVVIGLPIEYRKYRIQGVLDHEIGTHFLRKYNDNLQVWSNNRKKHDLRPYMTTEEGFAAINQLVNTVFHLALKRNGKPYLFKAALNYYSACKAHQMSFVELYHDLEKYIDCPKRRFKVCLRVKRGLVYTERPGGLYKDQIYLEGAVKILRKRKEIDFKGLYAGKIAIEDLERMQKKLRTLSLKLPWYLKDEKEYLKALDRIAVFNEIV